MRSILEGTRRRRWLALASLVVLAILAACGATRPAADQTSEASPGPQSRPLFATPQPHPVATVIDLVDGDTLVLSIAGSEAPVRLLSIDAPEADLGQCFAAAASAFVAAVAPPGAVLELERDVSEADPHGRLLRYAYLPDGSMLNEQLVRGGFARVTPEPPDQKYIERLRAAEDEAKRDGVGLWSECADDTGDALVAAPAPSSPTPARTPQSAATAAAIAPIITPTPTATPPPTPSSTPTPPPTPTQTPTPTATATPAPTATAAPTAAPPPAATAAPPPAQNCDPSYPSVCIPPVSVAGDLNCSGVRDVGHRNFVVLPPDPHRFDRDGDGIGCES